MIKRLVLSACCLDGGQFHPFPDHVYPWRYRQEHRNGEIIHFETIHEKMGLLLFLLLLIQVTIAALFQPSTTTRSTPDVSKVDNDDNNNETNNVGTEGENILGG